MLLSLSEMADDIEEVVLSQCSDEDSNQGENNLWKGKYGNFGSQ